MTLDFTKDNLSIWKILAVSCTLFMQYLKEISIMVAVVYIPLNCILLIINNASPDMEFVEYLKIINRLEAIIGIIATLGIATFLMKKFKNEETSSMDSLKEWLKSYGRVFWANLITWLMIIFLTLLFIVPWIIYWVYWMFVTFIVLVYKKNSSEAREYSKNIVKWRWWKIFWYSVVFWLLGAIGGFTIGFIEGCILWFIEWSLDASADQLIYIDNWMRLVFDTFLDIALSFFTIVSLIFFLAFDITKSTDNVIQENEWKDNTLEFTEETRIDEIKTN